MVGRHMLISWTTGGKPTASITLFLKFSGSDPLISADPHGSAGGPEPARLPSSAQTARKDSRKSGDEAVENEEVASGERVEAVLGPQRVGMVGRGCWRRCGCLRTIYEE